MYILIDLFSPSTDPEPGMERSAPASRRHDDGIGQEGARAAQGVFEQPGQDVYCQGQRQTLRLVRSKINDSV